VIYCVAPKGLNIGPDFAPDRLRDVIASKDETMGFVKYDHKAGQLEGDALNVRLKIFEAHLVARGNMSKLDLRGHFRKVYENAGHTTEEAKGTDSEASELMGAQLRETKAEIAARQVDAIAKAEPLPEIEYLWLRDTGINKTPEQKLQLKHTILLRNYGETPTPDLITLDNNGKYWAQVRTLAAQLVDKGALVRFDRGDIESTEKGVKMDTDWKHQMAPRVLFDSLGLNPSFDWRHVSPALKEVAKLFDMDLPEVGRGITKSGLADWEPVAIRHLEQISRTLGIYTTASEVARNPVTLLQKLAKKLGLTWAKAKQTRGKDRTYSLDAEQFARAMGFANREAKRQMNYYVSLLWGDLLEGSDDANPIADKVLRVCEAWEIDCRSRAVVPEGGVNVGLFRNLEKSLKLQGGCRVTCDDARLLRIAEALTAVGAKCATVTDELKIRKLIAT
jgi:hypothetical protein